MSIENQAFRRLLFVLTFFGGLLKSHAQLVAATPNHFSPKAGWTWVYHYSEFYNDRQFSRSTDAKLWLTLKTYQESDSQFSSTWSVGLLGNRASAHLIPPEFSSQSNISWADTNVIVNGLIRLGMRMDDFLPQAYKMGPNTPPLFLNHCTLPAVLSQEPSSGYTTEGNTIKPPFYVYTQFANIPVATAIYKDSVGLVALTTAIPPGPSHSMALTLVYFGKNPPERPVSIARGDIMRRNHRTQASLSRGHGSHQVRLHSPSRKSGSFADGLGRILP